MVMDLGLPSFNTVLFNADVTFNNRQCISQQFVQHAVRM